MLREEVPDAQRKESQRLWMEGEQGEDQNTGSGRDQVGPGGRVCALRGCIHGELGDSGIRWAVSMNWVPQSTACAPEPFLCLHLAGKPRFCLAFFRQTLHQVAN